MSDADIMLAAGALIPNEAAWYRKCRAVAGPTVCNCPITAIHSANYAAVAERYLPEADYLSTRLRLARTYSEAVGISPKLRGPNYGIPTWNDDPARTFAEVKAGFARAAALLREREGR